MVKRESFKGRESFKCEVCELHFSNKDLAEKCEEWCKRNESCNLLVARRSLEAEEGRSR